MNGERWEARVRRSAAQLAERRDVVVDISLEEDPPIRVANPRVLMGYENADDYPGSLARRLAVRGAPAPGGLGGEGFPRTDQPEQLVEVHKHFRGEPRARKGAGSRSRRL